MAITQKLGIKEVDEFVDAIEVERQRLGWSIPQSSDSLNEHFGKRSRWLLTDEELVQALELFRGEA